MSLLPILKFPDPRLHIVAKPVTAFDERLRRIASDMAETMYESDGVGLAATQINIHERLIVADTSPDKSNLITLVNPSILSSNNCQTGKEGCLSVPNVYEDVTRAAEIIVNYFDLNGNPLQLTTDGLLAVCIQHEIDHLNGIVFVQYLSQLKQARIRSKLGRIYREAF
jgi:peptide deformylase